MPKFIVITGGVLSGLGKGVVSASIGKLFSHYKVIPIKCDGYLNVDPGTMNPVEHGEVFVLNDGGEVDLDFGHYERFLNIDCKRHWNLTSGKVFLSLIEKERKGEFLGKTIQVIPHVTNEINNRIHKIAEEEKADIIIIEIGGTVGDYENMWFIDAMRVLQREVGHDNIIFVHLGFVPSVGEQKQQKTKPIQQSVHLLRERGIFPDIIIGRSDDRLSEKTKLKINWLCNVDKEAVISDPNTACIYELPLIFQEEGLREILAKHLKIDLSKDLVEWRALVEKINNPSKTINVALCGKYTEIEDSYISIQHALMHSGAHLDAKVNIKLIETTDIEEGKPVTELLNGIDGVIIPGGFGARGVEGKIAVIKHCRENNIPLLGLCYGLQLAVTEFARNICNLKDANTTENDSETKNPVIDILPEQKEITNKGGTMRLGEYKAILKPGTKVHALYNSDVAFERHRHRYEVNPDYHKILQENGLVLSGMSPDGRLVEYIELPNHKYFIATQAHPELTSRLIKPNPLFYGFVKAIVE